MNGASRLHTPPRLTTRRTLLRQGAGAALAAGFAAGAMPAAAYGIDWQKLLGDQMPEHASGVVRELVGQAFADGQPLAVGQRVPSGALVAVAAMGRAVIALEDGSIFTVFGGSKLELLLNRMAEGVLNLLAGALLLAVNTGGAFLVAGGTASFGVKGTVVYRQRFAAEERTVRTAEGPMERPAGHRDYFCTCRGETTFLPPDAGTPFHTVDAPYHEAYFLDPTDPRHPVRAPLLNHTDAQIRHLVGLQPGGKRHDASWLRD